MNWKNLFCIENVLSISLLSGECDIEKNENKICKIIIND